MHSTIVSTKMITVIVNITNVYTSPEEVGSVHVHT